MSETICPKLTTDWNNQKAKLMTELKVKDDGKKNMDDVDKMNHADKTTLLEKRNKFINEAKECADLPFADIRKAKLEVQSGGKSNKKRKMTKKRKSIKKRV